MEDEILDAEEITDTAATDDDFDQFAGGEEETTTPDEGQTSDEVKVEAQAQAEAEPTSEESESEPSERRAVINPPSSMNQQEKVEFAKLTPEMQQYVASREAQRDTGFNDKAADLAAEKRQVELHKEYNDLQVGLNKAKPEKPDLEMLNKDSDLYDPEKFQLLKLQYDNALEDRSGLEQKAHQFLEDRKAEEIKAQNTYIDDQQDLLLGAGDAKGLMPEWKDPSFRDDLYNYGTGLGVQPDAMQAASANELVILNKARLYDEMTASKVSMKDNLKTLPKVATTGTGAKEASRSNTSLKKYKKSGRIDDLDDAFDSFA